MSGEAWSKYIVKNMSPINEGMGKRATWENVFFGQMALLNTFGISTNPLPSRLKA